MATLKLNGDTSGYVILQAASVAQNNVLTLPNTTDTLLTSNGSVMNSATINGSTLNNPILAGSGVITGSLTGGTLANTTLSSPTITGSWSQQNLNLVGTSALVSNGVYIPAANTVGFITNTTERMRLTSGGNLLVNGTVTPLSGNATVVVSGLGTNGGGLQLAGGSAGGISQQSLNGGGLTWNTYTGAVGSETYAERMRLDSNGNLGVGVSTLSLGGRLTVGKASISSFTGAASGVVTVSDTSSTLNSYTALDFTNTNQQLPLARVAMQFTNSGSYLSLGTTNSYGSGINNNAVTIDPNSNVGIGTGAPGARLDVRGAATYLINSINPTAWFSSDATLSTQSMFNQFNTTSNVGIAGTYTNHPYVLAVNNIERMRVATTGYVGIGTAVPGYSLTVFNSQNAPTVAQIYNPSTGASAQSILQLQSGPANYVNILLTTSGSYFQIANSGIATAYTDFDTQVWRSGAGTERMRINSSGQVGIATATTNASLQVNGGIYNSSQAIIGATTTLTTACFGTLVEVNAVSAITITLPPISNGACFQFWLNTGQNITITTPSGAIYGPSGASAASQVLNISTGGSWYFFSCDGFNWFMTSVPWMSPTGSLLIGTTTAVGKITNYNGPISSGRLSSTNNWDNSNGSINLTSNGDGGSRGVITFGNSTTTAQNWHIVVGDNSNSFNWYSGNYGSGTIQMYLKNNGGIANYSGNNVNLSDARLKSNIELSGDYLDKICAIPVKNFHFTRDADGHYCLGVIAQDVEAVAPELVNQDGFGETPPDGVPYKTIYQTDLQYALMKSIQELKQLVDQQAAEIATLKAKIGE